MIPLEKKEKEIEAVTLTTPPSADRTLPKENGRPKSTINLQSYGKSQPKQETISDEPSTLQGVDKPVEEDELRRFFDEFAESRKHQAAEYQLLKREFTFQGSVVTLLLTNTFEEPLLKTINLQVTTFLREKLSNRSLSVVGVMVETGTKKVVYTNKEKFDHLAEKNPALRELKEKLGLDTDY